MATSAQLVKAIENGATVQTVNGKAVEYAPRYKGDRQPWSHRDGQGRYNTYRYFARELVVVETKAETKASTPAEVVPGPVAEETFSNAARETLLGLDLPTVIREALQLGGYNRDRNYWTVRLTAAQTTQAVQMLRAANAR